LFLVCSVVLFVGGVLVGARANCWCSAGLLEGCVLASVFVVGLAGLRVRIASAELAY